MRYLFLQLANFLNIFDRIGQSIILGYLLRHTSGEPGFEEAWKGYLFSAGLVIGSLYYAFSVNHIFLESQRIGMQIRTASCALLYRKVRNVRHLIYLALLLNAQNLFIIARFLNTFLLSIDKFYLPWQILLLFSKRSLNLFKFFFFILSHQIFICWG